MNSTIREDLEREVGHDHGVRDAENVVGVARAVEGEDADLRFAMCLFASLRVDGVEARERNSPSGATPSTRSL